MGFVDVLVAVVSFLAELFLSLGRRLWPANPATLKKRYYRTKREALEPKIKYVKEHFEEDDAVTAKQELRNNSARLVRRSDLVWGRDQRSQLKSAWLMALAAELSESAGDDEKAGLLHHFAGHGFRGVNEYEPAHHHYRASAECFVRQGNEEMKKKAIRSLRRAMGVLEQVKDEELIQQLRDREAQLRATGIEYP